MRHKAKNTTIRLGKNCLVAGSDPIFRVLLRAMPYRRPGVAPGHVLLAHLN